MNDGAIAQFSYVSEVNNDNIFSVNLLLFKHHEWVEGAMLIDLH